MKTEHQTGTSVLPLNPFSRHLRRCNNKVCAPPSEDFTTTWRLHQGWSAACSNTKQSVDGNIALLSRRLDAVQVVIAQRQHFPFKERRYGATEENQSRNDLKPLTVNTQHLQPSQRCCSCKTLFWMSALCSRPVAVWDLLNMQQTENAPKGLKKKATVTQPSCG